MSFFMEKARLVAVNNKASIHVVAKKKALLFSSIILRKNRNADVEHYFCYRINLI